MPLRVSAILATVALAVVAAGMSNGAPTAFPGKPGRIAYNVAASGKGASNRLRDRQFDLACER